MSTYDVRIPAGHVVLEGTLILPAAVIGVVIFAHGSGSSRHSPRNQHVAHGLNAARIATLLLDLLSIEEDETDWARHRRFDIGSLSRRLQLATDWVSRDDRCVTLPIAYFGASTGAAAALVAAAQPGAHIRAIVSRGGRPDLAMAALPKVVSPTLLIVGGKDSDVLRLNQAALAKLTCTKALRLVTSATHLFEEPGALDDVTKLATEWFAHYFTASRIEIATNPASDI